jgi:hypothetical protein
VQAIGLNALASGADNPLKAMQGINITPILNPRRSAATSEFDIFRTDGNVRPFIHQVEVPLTTSMVGAGSEHRVRGRRPQVRRQGRRGRRLRILAARRRRAAKRSIPKRIASERLRGARPTLFRSG